MENRMNIKLRFSKFFRSSFCSSKTKNTSQVLDHQGPVPSIPEDHTALTTTAITSISSSLNEPFISSKPKPPHSTTSYPSICRPRCPETFDAMIRESCFLKIHDHHSLPHRRKTSSKQPNSDHPRCPPVSSLMYYFLEAQAAETGMVATHDKDKAKKQRKKSTRRRTKQKSMMKGEGKYSRGTHLKKTNKSYALFHNPLSSPNDDDWFSSDDEREDHETTRDAFFSSLSSKSLSFSSNSISVPLSDSETNPAPTQILSRWRRSGSPRERFSRRSDGNCEAGLLPLQEEEEEKVVRETFAVVKSSSDPYSDFRESMLEMIVERQMFGIQDLEKLLECFLYLNSHHHHKLILDVFSEILEALFPLEW